jgi:acetamidase/formamidase
VAEHTIEPTADNIAYAFGGRAPVADVVPGEPFRLRTLDCFGGNVRSVDDLPSQVCQFPYLNPVTGPVRVAGANPGDTLAVHIVSLTPTSTTGFSSTFPHFGALTTTATTAMLHPALEERVWQYDIDLAAGTVRYTARSSDYQVDLPLDPMLGTIGVAPAAGEVRMSIVPDVHGGNLDVPDVRAGTTLYLGVNVDGALLAVGDGHARQGDGELCGVAVEIPITTTAVPRLESDTHLMSIGVAKPLEDAYRMGHRDLVAHVAELTGLDDLDAYQLVSQAGQARPGNVVDPNHTMLAAIDKTYLRGAHPYGGAHGALRAVRTAGE